MDFILPTFDPNSHKGEKGKVLIIGGSHRYHGAPIFSIKAAEAAGADLIEAFVPQVHSILTKEFALNAFINSFVKDALGLKDVGAIINATKRADAMLLGIGLGKETDTLRAIKLILSDVSIPTVLDADALLPEIFEIERNYPLVITPHTGEYQRLFGEDATEESAIKQAKKHNIYIVIKSRIDIIASPNNLYRNHTGCPQMRVGGTGDALAGIITSYIAQGLDPFDASVSACHYYGLLGEHLAKTQKTFTTMDSVRNYNK
ncbi:MAG: NAD(P)H-hydrate dehydratase [Alphaproteobacteria bacterium]|jgi:hydroxyethylthiazole kinase-like uncharacterized protein yjeF|nr:NAD(P)H-hydrate dehydratase [Candidatus Jidaibacter sp.]